MLSLKEQRSNDEFYKKEGIGKSVGCLSNELCDREGPDDMKRGYITASGIKRH